MKLYTSALVLAVAAAVSASVHAGEKETSKHAPEVAVSYSFLQEPEYSGWNLALGSGPDRTVGFAVNASGYYADGSAMYLFAAGPRLAHRAEYMTLFAHVLAGALAGGDGGALVAFPGVGVDLQPSRHVGLRLQLDWPLITNFGVITDVPRFSAGLVLRPRQSR